MWAHATDCDDSSEKQHTRQSLIPEREREREREREKHPKSRREVDV